MLGQGCLAQKYTNEQHSDLVSAPTRSTGAIPKRQAFCHTLVPGALPPAPGSSMDPSCSSIDSMTVESRILNGRYVFASATTVFSSGMGVVVEYNNTLYVRTLRIWINLELLTLTFYREMLRRLLGCSRPCTPYVH